MNRVRWSAVVVVVLGAAACSDGVATEPPGPVETDPPAEAEVVGSVDPPTGVAPDGGGFSYPIVDTGQTWCFSADEVVPCEGSGQDAEYEGLQPAYQDNGDGTVTDLNTGLMWIADAGEKTFYADAMAELETYTFAGYDDWRLPTIKELYSLALFSGIDASVGDSSDVEGLWPFIDEDYFVFLYGDESDSARIIDAQWLTGTIYDSTVMGEQSCFFGFNFSDGRIKCYPLEQMPNGGYYAQYVRGDSGYGTNDFVDNGDGTVSDLATGLTWTQSDGGTTHEWDDALNYCEGLTLAGSEEWRLPNIKELHSIVDYSRSPDVTESPAIDSLFDLTEITNEAGEPDYGHYWSSTTLISYPSHVGSATYISFGRALGYQDGLGGWVDVHGAGAQRSDPKVLGETYETGHGPQGDAVRGDNYALCVLGGEAQLTSGDEPESLQLASDVITPGDDQQSFGAGDGGPDLATAATRLGVTEDELRSALGAPPPNLNETAIKLGVSVDELREALGHPPESG